MPPSEDNSAIALLTRDHSDVEALFATYHQLVDDEVTGDDRYEIADQICEALTVHAVLEEEIFYPAAREAAQDATDELDEAEVEHASMRDLIEQIQDMDPEEDLYNAKIRVLGEYVAHHINEEEGDVFPKVKQSLLNLEELGEQLKARKDELLNANRSPA